MTTMSSASFRLTRQQEMIEHKRRQNTLAARKSRKRKLEHTHAYAGKGSGGVEEGHGDVVAIRIEFVMVFEPSAFLVRIFFFFVSPAS